MLLANFNGKEHLLHRAVSLRQHGFLVVQVISNHSLEMFTELTNNGDLKTGSHRGGSMHHAKR